MRITYHIPTEQYGFMEVETFIVEENGETPISYEAIKATITPNPVNQGLGPKEWNKALDGYIASNSMDAEVYEAMNDTQKMIIQEIKRSAKRITYNNDKTNTDRS